MPPLLWKVEQESGKMWLAGRRGRKQESRPLARETLGAQCWLSASWLWAAWGQTLSQPCDCHPAQGWEHSSGGLSAFLASHCPISLWIWADGEHWRTSQRSQEGGLQSLRGRVGHPTHSHTWAPPGQADWGTCLAPILREGYPQSRALAGRCNPFVTYFGENGWSFQFLHV